MVGPGGERAAVIRFVARRVAIAAPTLVGIVAAVFLLFHLAPGDPASALSTFGGRRVPPEAAEALRHTYGLDRPLPAQFVIWASRAARLDFGRSFQDHRRVAARIAEALPYTAGLNAVALLLTLLVGIPLGVAQARHAGTAGDRAGNLGLLLLYSTPSFWVAMLAVTVFSARLGWLPLFGVASDGAAHWPLTRRLWDLACHAALPLACLTYGSLAYFARMVRAGVLAESGRLYVAAARARGASAARAVWAHALRNALLPLITVVGLLVPALLSGSVIIEQIFAWPGLGRLFYGAILARDYPVVLGLTTFTAVLTLAALLAADLLYAVADPRLRHE